METFTRCQVLLGFVEPFETAGGPRCQEMGRGAVGPALEIRFEMLAGLGPGVLVKGLVSGALPINGRGNGVGGVFCEVAPGRLLLAPLKDMPRSPKNC